MEPLDEYSIFHAGVRTIRHPRLGAPVENRSAIRYVRFLRPVRLDRLELPYAVYGRWTPQVPTHPAHLVVSVLDAASKRWQVVKEFEPPCDGRIRGDGLSQDMTEDQMNDHFRQVLQSPPRTFSLDGLETDHIRVACDREHPAWCNHGECNGSVHQVPFGILDPLRAFGRPLADLPAAPYLPILKPGTIRPRAPKGMKVTRRGETILFTGKKLSVGFALRRPILMHLGWDALGAGLAERNRLSCRRVRFTDHNRGVSGPLAVTLGGDHGSHHWTGRVSVQGNKVAYERLRCAAGVRVDAVFHVEPDRLVVELSQRAAANTAVLEAEAFRLVWSLGAGMTGVAGMPTGRAGRSGDIQWPAMFAGDGVGCLSCRVLDGRPDAVALQAESYRSSNEVSAGVVLGPRPGPEQCQVVPARKVSATVEWAVSNLQPPARRGRKPGLGVRRHWASAFSCYRPEWGGFSNHAASVNCLVNQNGQIEVAAFTARPKVGPDPLDAARFSVSRALLDGGGYGYWRNLYTDADPVLVSAAGRIFQARPDDDWLRHVQPGLVEAVERMLGGIGPEGLAVNRDLSGNSGSHRWSSNALDVVGFGHMDAYVNAWTYRALRSGGSLLGRCDRQDLARRCRRAADALKGAFATYLVNPETGWVAGWRSRDGKLHDYAHLCVNGPACAFGVLEPKAARRALRNLERLRARLGLQSARLGVPFSMLALDIGDHMLPVIKGWKACRTEPSFEFFTDGSCAPSAATYYLRALSIHGLKDNARQMAADLDAGFADGLFTGGAGADMGQGNEFLSWEGLASGYEGTFGPTFGPLYAIAIEQGLFDPLEPEWWPAEAT